MAKVSKYKVKSPAKLNLSLEVLAKRPDGYHEIRSLMVPIDIFDEITIETGGRGVKCVCRHPDVPSGPSNLAHRAAVAFMEAAGERFGVRIYIEKNIPVAAGLGGGSSNAAAVLTGLNSLRGERLGRKKMMELAAGLGSDVPFFMKTGAQWARGRGERLRAGPKLPPWTYLVVFPGIKISAGWAYNSMPLTIKNKKNTIRYFKVGGVRLVNHLEAGVFGAYPEIGKLKERLLASGARAVLMAGSGSSVFGIFDNRSAASRAKRVFGDNPDVVKVFLSQQI